MVRMPHWPIPHRVTPTRVCLTIMTTLMHALDNPHHKLPPVIHVAGTNGKGSTIAYLKAIFESAGYKVHVYTSPHLLEFNERIVIAGEKIFDNHLLRLCERVRGVSEKAKLDITFFEATTAAAFLAFSETPADVILLETGLGGRLDATNIIPNPLMTIITPISYDHMHMLGPTLPIIAAEKAGIIKPGVSCIISAQVDEVMNVFLNFCAEHMVEAIVYGYDFVVDRLGSKMLLECANGKKEYPLPALLGDHQILNAGSVIMACDLLKESFNITDQHIEMGLQRVEWPGRLQKIKYASSYIWLDGAHNSGAAQVLAIWIKENLKKPIALILGMTKNRDALTFASFFKDIVDKIYCVRVYSEPSSYTANKLAELVGPSGIEVIVEEDLDQAILGAMSLSKEVVVTGSLFLVADTLLSKINRGQVI